MSAITSIIGREFGITIQPQKQNMAERVVKDRIVFTFCIGVISTDFTANIQLALHNRHIHYPCTPDTNLLKLRLYR